VDTSWNHFDDLIEAGSTIPGRNAPSHGIMQYRKLTWTNAEWWSWETMPMDVGIQLALSSPWWSWDSRMIRKALWASVLVRLLRQGGARLKENQALGNFPADWKDVAYLRREPKTQQRLFKGENNLCLELLVGYASLLNIDTQLCFPDTRTWIAEATVYLSRFAAERVSSVRLEDASVYVEHILPIVGKGSVVEATFVEKRLEQLSGQVRPIVTGVARSIAPVLVAHAPTS
jgi:hypothetical protein